MRVRRWYGTAPVIVFAVSCLAWTAKAQRHAIDTAKSVMTVRVYKAGVLSAFGHDHEIAAPITGGNVDSAGHHVELHTNASGLRVRDPKASEKDRDEIQKTMLGPDVLDADRYPEIVFRSTAVEPMGPGLWKVQGTLTVHGQTQPVTAEVREKTTGRYAGNALFKLTDFAIKPVRIAGGAVKVKDEIRIEFDIQLAQ
jgi:polyisoprenoid-binding protein YceI